MSNPLFNQYGNNSYSNVIQRFNQFKQSFHGDPKQQVQNLLNSGKVSQQQYNQAVQMANEFAKLFK